MAGCRLVSGQDLLRMRLSYEHEHGRKEGWRRMAKGLKEELQKKTISPHDFSIRDLMESLVPDGREYLNDYVRPRNSESAFLEATGAVDTSLFFNITGQLLITEVQDKFMDEEFVFMKEIEHKPSKIFVGMERLPGFSRIGVEGQRVAEGQAYPLAGLSEDWIEIAPKTKRGFIVPMTREAVEADLTGQLMEYAGESAFFEGQQTEINVIDAVIDENAGATSAVNGGHRYHWKSTSYATYQATTPWDNVTASNALVDWTDLDNCWQTMAAITHPYTGQPLLVQPDCMIVSSSLAWRAAQIVAATQVRNTTPGFAVSANPVQYDSANPVQLVLGGKLKILTSRLLTARLATDTTWFMGNLKKAVRRYYNWDIETSQAPQDSQEAFHRDIVTQFKVSVRDVVSVIQPRYLASNTA